MIKAYATTSALLSLEAGIGYADALPCVKIVDLYILLYMRLAGFARRYGLAVGGGVP